MRDFAAMESMTTRPVQFPGPVGALRGRLRTADGDAPTRGGAVVCHPHPAFGGNMDVWLLPSVGEALAADGWDVLRFDFASVGGGMAPDGHANAHAAERADLAAAISFLRGESPRTAAGRLALVGWSFGALVAALHGVEDPAVTDWVGIAPATRSLPELAMAAPPASLLSRWSARRSVIAGAHDQFFPPAFTAVYDPHAVHVLADCDHFFFDHDREVAGLAVCALREETFR